jgi:hypothetical protein
MRENPKRGREDLLVREVSITGTVLRSTSYDEKKEMVLHTVERFSPLVYLR